MELDNLSNTIRKIMSKKFITCSKDDSLKSVIEKMVINSLGEILIVENKKILGIFTTADLTNAIKDNKNNIIKKYMTKDVLTVEINENVYSARNIMEKYNIKRLPVTENKEIVGMVYLNDLIKFSNKYISYILNFQKNILDNIHEAVCICNKEGKILYFNKSAEKLYNLKSEDIINKYINECFDEPIIDKVLKDKKAIENVKNEPIKGKKVILSAIPIFDDNNDLIAAVSTDRDITEIEDLYCKLKDATEEIEILNRAFNREISNNYTFPYVIGKSKKIIDILNVVQKVATSSASVLITGESGTGKEVIAKEIHKCSGRKGPFIAVNCSAIPKNLLESELFGYVGGAFTGAMKNGKKGMFEFANNGTLFLDEIGEMPLSMQSELLRVLQDGVFYRLGSETPIRTDVRVIEATNKDLEKAIKDKEFREDLYFRLAVIRIKLPSLRERREDIREFINYFTKKVSEDENININFLSEDVYEILSKYKWEGNIRELKNIVQRMVILSNDGIINKDSIPKYILDYFEENKLKNSLTLENKFDLEKRKELLEYELIKEAMVKTNGNKTKAAKLLNLKRTTLYYKLRQYKFM